MTRKWALVVLAAVLSSSIISCIKEPIDEVNIPASAEEVQNALAEGWGQADPLTMQPNDFLFQETEQRVESDPKPFFVLQEGITIVKKEETASDFLYTFLYQTRVIKQDQEQPASTREDHRTVSKPTAAAPTPSVSNLNVLQLMMESNTNDLQTLADDYQMILGFERLYGLAYACVKSDNLDKYCKEQLKVESCEIQCANLKVLENITPVPDLMKEQPNCGGFTNCSYKTKKINFDWTIALKNGQTVEKQRVNYSVTLSPDLPFFARMTEFCARQLVTVQNQKVLVNSCTKLKNFKKGEG